MQLHISKTIIGELTYDLVLERDIIQFTESILKIINIFN
jgi:hypothetical protein